jgi:hypothetical protein
MKWVLETDPRQIEREVGFVQRSTALLDGSRFVQALVFGWMFQPEASYSQLTTVANSLGPAVSPQAVEQRFSAASATLLKEVLQEAGTQLLTGEGEVPELLARFAGVYLQDGSLIALPDAFAQRYPGNGKEPAQPGSSQLRIQVRWEIAQGGLDGLWLQPGREPEGKGEAQNLQLPVGSLFIGDSGYLDYEEMRERGNAGGYWLVAARAAMVLFDEQGVRFDLVSLLQRRGQSGRLDCPIQVGVKDRLPCRLVAIRRPGQTSKERRHTAPKSRKGVQRCRPGQTKYPKGQKAKTRLHRMKCSPARQ